MAKSFNTPKEEISFQINTVSFSPEVTSTTIVEKTPVVIPVVETKPIFDKAEIVAKLGELASIFRTMYGEQLNPVFAEIHKSLSNAQYKIMQNL
jgi:hypothetical protein